MVGKDESYKDGSGLGKLDMNIRHGKGNPYRILVCKPLTVSRIERAIKRRYSSFKGREKPACGKV